MLPLPLGFVVQALATGSYTLRRQPYRAYLKGRVQPAATADQTISACVQPAGDVEVRDPEGNYRRASKRVLSTSTLQASSDTHEADHILIDGEWHAVAKVDPWAGAAGYYEAFTLVADAPPPDPVP